MSESGATSGTFKDDMFGHQPAEKIGFYLAHWRSYCAAFIGYIAAHTAALLHVFADRIFPLDLG